MFKCVDEMDHFSFADCVLVGFEKSEDSLTAELEALIIKAANSQNDNCTDSYAGTSFLKFVNGKTVKADKAGYRYYNADGVLTKSVPDEPVPSEKIPELLKMLRGSYLAACEPVEGGFLLEIEMCEEDGAGDTYLLTVTCDKTVVTWDRYLNRVQS